MLLRRYVLAGQCLKGPAARLQIVCPDVTLGGGRAYAVMTPSKGIAGRLLTISVTATAAVLSCKGDPAPTGAAVPSGAAVPAVPSSGPPRVEAGADGFQPSRVVLGGAKQVIFRRTTDETCATEVVFPELGIEKKLPLNTDVVIDLPASAPAELGFQCGMAMYKSKIVAR